MDDVDKEFDRDWSKLKSVVALDEQQYTVDDCLRDKEKRYREADADIRL